MPSITPELYFGCTFPFPRLLNSRGLQRHPHVHDAMFFRLSHSEYITSRDVCMNERWYQLWSINGGPHAFYPGPFNTLPKAADIPLSEHRRIDGSLGRFDWALTPQHFDATRPWLPFVERELARPMDEHEQVNPELMPAPLVWVPTIAGYAMGEVGRGFVGRLMERNRYLDAQIGQARKVFGKGAKEWVGRPRSPTERELELLGEEMPYSRIVDTLTAAQRGLKEKAAWVHMARSLHLRERRGGGRGSSRTASVGRRADARYLGVWINGMGEDDVRWLVDAGVACYVVHQYQPGVDFPLSSSSSPSPSSLRTSSTSTGRVQDRRGPNPPFANFVQGTELAERFSKKNNAYVFVAAISKTQLSNERLEEEGWAERVRMTREERERSASWAVGPPPGSEGSTAATDVVSSDMSVLGSTPPVIVTNVIDLPDSSVPACTTSATPNGTAATPNDLPVPKETKQLPTGPRADRDREKGKLKTPRAAVVDRESPASSRVSTSTSGRKTPPLPRVDRQAPTPLDIERPTTSPRASTSSRKTPPLSSRVTPASPRASVHGRKTPSSPPRAPAADRKMAASPPRAPALDRKARPPSANGRRTPPPASLSLNGKDTPPLPSQAPANGRKTPPLPPRAPALDRKARPPSSASGRRSSPRPPVRGRQTPPLPLDGDRRATPTSPRQSNGRVTPPPARSAPRNGRVTPPLPPPEPTFNIQSYTNMQADNAHRPVLHGVETKSRSPSLSDSEKTLVVLSAVPHDKLADVDVDVDMELQWPDGEVDETFSKVDEINVDTPEDVVMPVLAAEPRFKPSLVEYEPSSTPPPPPPPPSTLPAKKKSKTITVKTFTTVKKPEVHHCIVLESVCDSAQSLLDDIHEADPAFCSRVLKIVKLPSEDEWSIMCRFSLVLRRQDKGGVEMSEVVERDVLHSWASAEEEVDGDERDVWVREGEDVEAGRVVDVEVVGEEEREVEEEEDVSGPRAEEIDSPPRALPAPATIPVPPPQFSTASIPTGPRIRAANGQESRAQAPDHETRPEPSTHQYGAQSQAREGRAQSATHEARLHPPTHEARPHPPTHESRAPHPPTSPKKRRRSVEKNRNLIPVERSSMERERNVLTRNSVDVPPRNSGDVSTRNPVDIPVRNPVDVPARNPVENSSRDNPNRIPVDSSRLRSTKIDAELSSGSPNRDLPPHMRPSSSSRPSPRRKRRSPTPDVQPRQEDDSSRPTKIRRTGSNFSTAQHHTASEDVTTSSSSAVVEAYARRRERQESAAASSSRGRGDHRERVVPKVEETPPPGREVKALPTGPRAEEKVVPSAPRAEEKAAPVEPRVEEQTVPTSSRAEEKAMPTGPRGEELVVGPRRRMKVHSYESSLSSRTSTPVDKQRREDIPYGEQKAFNMDNFASSGSASTSRLSSPEPAKPLPAAPRMHGAVKLRRPSAQLNALSSHDQPTREPSPPPSRPPTTNGPVKLRRNSTKTSIDQPSTASSVQSSREKPVRYSSPHQPPQYDEAATSNQRQNMDPSSTLAKAPQRLRLSRPEEVSQSPASKKRRVDVARMDAYLKINADVSRRR